MIVGAVEGLEPGVYHFGPGDFSLRRLRAGDFRGAVALAAADDALAAQPATVILSAIYWRNTWKYQARGYRHLFWDSGTLLGQFLAAARALDLPARSVTGFVDAQLNGLLGLDAEKEGALVAVPLGAPGPVAAASPVIVTLDARSRPALPSRGGLPAPPRRLRQLQPRLRSRGRRLGSGLRITTFPAAPSPLKCRNSRLDPTGAVAGGGRGGAGPGGD